MRGSNPSPQPSSRKTAIPVAIVTAAILLGIGVVMWNSTPAHRSPVVAIADRGRIPDRADRGELRPMPSATPTPTPTKTVSVQTQPAGTGSVTSSGTCKASYYDQGQRTANGEWFNPDAFTAANKTMPFNTRVRVTNLANNKSVVVRINDRGPFVTGRCLDLSRAAFAAIASLSSGVVSVKYDVLS